MIPVMTASSSLSLPGAHPPNFRLAVKTSGGLPKTSPEQKGHQFELNSINIGFDHRLSSTQKNRLYKLCNVSLEFGMLTRRSFLDVGPGRLNRRSKKLYGIPE